MTFNVNYKCFNVSSENFEYLSVTSRNLNLIITSLKTSLREYDTKLSKAKNKNRILVTLSGCYTPRLQFLYP